MRQLRLPQTRRSMRVTQASSLLPPEAARTIIIMALGGVRMRTDVAAVLLGVAAACAGCVSHGRSEDVETVRSVLATRADLEIADRDAEAWDDVEPAVGAVLSRPLRVSDAVHVALLNNRDLRAQIAELGIARGQLVQAGLLPNPTLEGSVRFPDDGVQPPQIDIGVAINLTTAILAPMRASAASARLDVARLQTAGAVLDLAYRVRLAYYRCQASAQRVELMRTAMESFAASAATARELRAAGNVRDLDVAMEEAAYEESRIDVSRAELEFLDDRERLNVLLGLFGRDVAWELVGRMPDPNGDAVDTEDLERRAIEASLELAWTRAELEAIGRSLGVARAEGLVPDIQLGVHAEYDEQRWEFGPEMALTLPILSQGQGNVLAREAELEAIRERYVGLAIAVRASVRAARNRALTTELLARRYREVLLPARTRVFEQTLLQYNAMQVDVFRLLQARREQIDAAREYLDVLRDHWQARATLEQVLAGRLAGTIGPDAIAESLDTTPRASSTSAAH